MQEVEALCNRIIILNKGEIIADGTTEEIKKWSNIRSQQVIISVAEKINPDFFSKFPFIRKTEPLNNNEFIIYSSVEEDIRPLIFRTIADNNLTLLTLYEKSGSLETIFRELTQS
jgi:ABC-2 type transport system ATP-binding protein